MFIPYYCLWIAGIVLAIVVIVVAVALSNRNKRISDLSAAILKAKTDQAAAERKAAEERLYSTSWFRSEVAKFEEKAAAEAEARRKWREEHPDASQTHFQRIPPDPTTPVFIEREMLEKCKNAHGKEAQRNVIIEYVPKVITSLLNVRDYYSFPDIVEELKEPKLVDDYCDILKKYRIQGVIKHIEE